jgi:hypothetical protein
LNDHFGGIYDMPLAFCLFEKVAGTSTFYNMTTSSEASAEMISLLDPRFWTKACRR